MKVVFFDIVHPALMDGLTKQGYNCLDLTNDSVDSIIEKIHDVEGIIIRSRFPLNADFLSKAKNLKFIARSGAGLENIDLEYCVQNGVELFAAPEGNRNAVAEHALGMLLSLFNNLHKTDLEVRNGIWDREGNRGVELDGKIVGIIGYGNNGSAFAKKMLGFDVEVLAYDKYKSGFGNDIVKESELTEILCKADVISLHIPQNEETTEMINADFISKVEKPFYLINLSRGKIVKTGDLLDGIENGQVLGACLDVLEFEKSSFEKMFESDNIKTSFSRLLSSKKIILSPHVGGWSHESYRLLSEVLLSKIINHYGRF